MLVSIHQPAYIPWLGYFDKIKRSDVFIIMDSVQYEKGSFINRNLIKAPNGPAWLSIPVITKGHLNKNISQMRIDNSKNWQSKHLKSLIANYKKAVNFAMIMDLISPFYKLKYESLLEYTMDYLRLLLKIFEIDTKLVLLSEVKVSSSKSNLVLDVCKKLKADVYLSGALGSDYLNLNDFQDNNIEVKFQNFTSNEYEQLWGGYIPNLSCLDYLFNRQKNDSGKRK